MADDFFPETIPDKRVTEGLTEMRRELGMRERMCPQWVHAGRMKQEVADRQIARLKGVIELLEAMAT